MTEHNTVTAANTAPADSSIDGSTGCRQRHFRRQAPVLIVASLAISAAMTSGCAATDSSDAARPDASVPVIAEETSPPRIASDPGRLPTIADNLQETDRPDAFLNSIILAAESGPPSPIGSYLAGRFAQSDSDWNAAANFFSRTLSVDPDNTQLRRQTFLLGLGAGRLDQAVDLAPSVGPADGEHEVAVALLVADDIRAGRPDDAIERLAGLGPRGLSRYLVPLLTAWAELGREDTDAALAALDGLADSEGFRPVYLLHRARLLEIAGQEEAAAAAFDSLIEEGVSVRTLSAVGGHLERTGRNEEAAALYDRALTDHPDGPIGEYARVRANASEPPRLIDSPARGAAEALFDLANALDQETASDMALLYVRIALHLAPGFDEAHLLTGEILADRGRHDEAIEEFRAIGGPLALVAGLREADSLVRAGREDEAIARLEEVAKARPGRPEPVIQLGDVHRRASRFLDAIQSYDQAIDRIGEENLERRHWPLLYSRGIAYERSKNWPKAEKDLLHALEFEPDQPFVLNYLGYTWADQGVNIDEALDMIERAVSLRPNDGFIVDSLGWVEYRLGNYDVAVGHLERAVELEPDDPVINDHLGDAYWQVGRFLEARFQWQRALDHADADDDADLIETIQAKLRDGLVETQASNNTAD